MTPVAREVAFRATVECSRFFAVLSPAADEAVLRRQHRKHHRAVHRCRAWHGSAPDDQEVERSKDDGEIGQPGPVLLETLRRHDLAGEIAVARISGGVTRGAGRWLAPSVRRGTGNRRFAEDSRRRVASRPAAA